MMVNFFNLQRCFESYFRFRGSPWKQRGSRLVLAWVVGLFLFVAPIFSSTGEVHSSVERGKMRFVKGETLRQYSSANDAWRIVQSGMDRLSSDSPFLEIPLGEVILLILLVNVFALFKKSRLIMVVSYLFCAKWVFWLNYNELLKHSSAIFIASGYIFALCGVLTLVLFCMDRFGVKDQVISS